MESASDKSLMQEALEAVTLLLSPIVPHISHDLWKALGHDTVLIDQPWPTVDPEALKQDSVLIMLQVNGKLRGKIEVETGASKDAIEALAMADANVLKHTEGKTIRKVIVVPGKLVSVVAN